MRVCFFPDLPKPLIFSFPLKDAVFYKAGPAMPYGHADKQALLGDKNIMRTTAYSRAYALWFASYDAERRRQHKRPGATLAGFPAPPTNPADLAAVVDHLGARRVLDVLQIHRATLARWLAGEATIPPAAWLVLAMLADGRLPGMSAAWRDFRFDGDRLHLIGTRYSWSAQEIAGWPHLLAHMNALAAQVRRLERQLAKAQALNTTGAANDPISRTG